MDILKKILAVLVMILTVIGVVLSLALLVGSWAINTPVTNGATGSLLLVENYIGMAEQVTGRVDGNLESILVEVTIMETTLSGMDANLFPVEADEIL